MMKRSLLAALALFAASAFAEPPSENLLVGLREGASPDEVAADDAELDGEIAPLGVWRMRAKNRGVKERLKHRKDVIFVERDELVPPDVTPNDPLYPEQWHLPKIGAPAAWGVSRSLPSVVVAVVDSGADPSHPDLASKLVPGRNVRDDNFDTTDTSGHGTRVCGSAAAATNNGIGVAGIGWLAGIMPIKAAEPSGSAFISNLAEGIVWAADHDAFAANVSFSGMASSPTIRTAAEYAMARDTIVVASAGNCGCDDPTSENPFVLSVGATNQTDGAASFTSRGQYVDLSAPGVSILTTAIGGGYSPSSGTSFAAPIAMGVLALMRTAHPTLGIDQLIERIESTALDLGPTGYDATFGTGRVQADRAVAGGTVSTRTPTRTPTSLLCGLPLLPLCPTPVPTRTPTQIATRTPTPTCEKFVGPSWKRRCKQ